MCNRFRFLFSLSLSFLLSFSFSPLPCQARVKNDRPLVWDMTQLDRMRLNVEKSKAAQNILKSADSLCGIRPVAVTDKKKLTFEPDRHYFCSLGRYWWPDSLHPGQYVQRDGVVNPEIKEYDNARMTELVSRCKTLSRAFYISGERKYYDAFVRQLRVWFLDKETYMYPTFEYAQIVPGKNDNKGRCWGMISAYGFNTLIESIRLVNGVERIDRRTMKGVKKWFVAFADDSEERFGKELRKGNNNIALAYDVTMANMYLFAGKTKKAKAIVDGFATLRLEQQIMADGSQPAELKRTKAFSYSVYNLTHVVDFCYLARYWYPDYYREHGARVDKAFELLGRYLEDPKKFPYQEISSWETCAKDYKKQLERLSLLKKANQLD